MGKGFENCKACSDTHKKQLYNNLEVDQAAYVWQHLRQGSEWAQVKGHWPRGQSCRSPGQGWDTLRSTGLRISARQ